MVVFTDGETEAQRGGEGHLSVAIPIRVAEDTGERKLRHTGAPQRDLFAKIPEKPLKCAFLVGHFLLKLEYRKGKLGIP